eukprot:CAMPEP_0117522568 /NCGR_PEP_ID=MMETSP0784-20121206/34274_1 /TAXON_ID=39447 /ORGANISM="" /LENGTH=415 /DNA_ID=CAMNT_0005318643 /DNA_START=52 /DNA_END=1299 /DNA_ORIENTATION=-
MAIVELGGLECAAGEWLRRLRREEKLASKSTLETLRRRERTARQRAEALADSERRCSELTKERLEDAYRLRALQESAVLEANDTLKTERALRIEAEVRLAQVDKDRSKAEQELAAERDRREAFERMAEKLQAECTELRHVIADDQSLRALDEFSAKFEVQRSEIAKLQDLLETQRERAEVSERALENAVRDLDCARKDWDRQSMRWQRDRDVLVQERDTLVCDRDAAYSYIEELREAGAALQAAAEAALQGAADVEELFTACEQVAAAMESDMVHHATEGTIPPFDFASVALARGGDYASQFSASTSGAAGFQAPPWWGAAYGHASGPPAFDCTGGVPPMVGAAARGGAACDPTSGPPASDSTGVAPRTAEASQLVCTVEAPQRRVFAERPGSRVSFADPEVEAVGIPRESTEIE